MSTPLNLEQLRKQAKELTRASRAAGRPAKLADAQLELARQHGFASWPWLKDYVERLNAEQPFHTDIEYYEGRADGIATVNGVTTAEARRDLAQKNEARGELRISRWPRRFQLRRTTSVRRGSRRRAAKGSGVPRSYEASASGWERRSVRWSPDGRRCAAVWRRTLA